LALYELAAAEDRLDAIATDLQQVRRLLAESADLRRLFSSPVVSREDQGRAIAALAGRAGLDDLTRRFLGVLARNRRLAAVPVVIDTFLAQLAAARGETTAEVASARQLTDAQAEDLRVALRNALGGDVVLTQRVEPALLGGLVVKVGSRMVDSSLRTKLQQLRLTMKGIG
jgi:F-type H+-transporting ATPase subunit delta